MGEIRQCQVCGNTFEAHSHGPRKYCSKKCRNKVTGRIIQLCPICGNEFVTLKNSVMNGKGVYCSIKCYSTAQSQKINCTCKTCGKEFTSVPSRVTKGESKYCSRECFAESIRGQKSPMWKEGASFGKYCELFNHNFKKRVRSFFNNTCVLCGKTENDIGRQLCVHHVHYDKKSCCDNNVPRLFVTLCTQCHAATNHNRKHWEKFFIQLINDNYDGKCYYTKEEYENLS